MKNRTREHGFPPFPLSSAFLLENRLEKRLNALASTVPPSPPPPSVLHSWNTVPASEFKRTSKQGIPPFS